jgi:hypothetical protein
MLKPRAAGATDPMLAETATVAAVMRAGLPSPTQLTCSSRDSILLRTNKIFDLFLLGR